MVMLYEDKFINGVIYKTTNLIDGKWYIGKDEKNNPEYLGSGVYLNRAVSIYGRENFKKEILAESNSRKELIKLEIEFIEKFNAVKDKNSYNIASGGLGGDTLGGLDNDDREKFSNKMKEVFSKMPEEKKLMKSLKLSKALSGRKKTIEHKEKISKSKVGIKQDQKTCEKKRLISKKLYEEGKICPPKVSWLGKTHSIESRKKNFRI